jgi:hypothetical protein
MREPEDLIRRFGGLKTGAAMCPARWRSRAGLAGRAFEMELKTRCFGVASAQYSVATSRRRLSRAIEQG